MKLLTLMMTLVMAGSSAFAAEDGSIHLAKRFGLGFGGGVPIPVLFSLFHDKANIGWSVEGHADYYLTDAFGIELQYQHLTFQTGKPLHNSYTLGFNHRWLPTARVTPIWGLAGGWGNATALQGLDGNVSNFVAQGKVGLMVAMSENVAMEAVAKYYWLFSKTDGRRDQQAIIPSIGFTYFFGKPADSTVAYPESTPVPVATPAAKVDGDDDNDGILNSVDRCPNTPAGSKVNSFGCTVEDKINETVNVEFPSGKSVIPADYYPEVDKIVALLNEHKDVKVEIQGYTDNVGKKTSNLRLSHQRANAVRNYIVKQGADKTRISAKGYGDADPVADNSSPEGRKQNRRVVALIQSK